MKAIILKKQIDEAGNIGYIFDEEFEGSEEEIRAHLAELNLEGYDHIAEIQNEIGVRVIEA
jgi:hypothetical protein